MDSFRYILYVYKRTILRASGREKDKRTRCGSARRSNGKTGGEKTHQHEYGWVVCDYYSSPLITPGSKNRTHSDSGLLSWDNEGHLPDKSLFFNWTQSQHMGNMEKNGSLSTRLGGYVTSAIRYVQTAITNISSNVQPYISVYVWRRTA